MPLWEAALVWPFRIVTFPLTAVTAGIGAGAVELQESHVLYEIQRLLGPRTLLWGLKVNMTAGGLPGLGGGVTFFHNRFFGEGNTFELGGKGTVRGSRRATLGIKTSGPTEVQVGAGYRLQPNARYFGIGPETEENDESFYTLQQNWVGVSVNRTLTGPLSMEAEALYTEAGAREGGDERPSLRTAFGTALPAGYPHTSDGVSGSLSLIRDTVAPGGRPDRGAFYRATLTRFEGTGGEAAAFWRYRGELQQFVPLWFSHRALAVRGFVTWIDSGGDVVPFPRLMTNDDPDLLRGYRDFRWRDRGMAAGTAEYRWPLWAAKQAHGLGLDAYLFTDIGQVFGGRKDISLEHLTVSYGGGLRLVNSAGFLARLEIGASDEETIIRFRTDQVFQFSKGNLFHGQNPVPQR
jgi:outer membrane protein assembly factor BamA